MKLDDQLISQAIFHPRAELDGYSPRGIFTSTPSGSEKICGYLHPNHSAHTLMIFFHGNGKIAAEYDDLAEFYVNCGVSFWVLDYPGYGQSTGEPVFSRLAMDAEAVLADVSSTARRAGIDASRILIMGRSLGSAPAVYLASIYSQRLSGLVLDSPFAHGLELVHRLGGPQLAREDIKDFSDNIDRMKQCDLPALIIHGTQDGVIPVSDARELYEACPNPTKELIEIEPAGHNDLLTWEFERYFKAIRDFVGRVAGA